MGLESKSIYQR